MWEFKQIQQLAIQLGPSLSTNFLTREVSFLMRLKILLSTSLIIASFLLWGCSSQAPAQTPAVVTVEKTVPVEVTRIVEQTVEVTRQVVETAIVQVPVTVTPTPTPQVNATPEPSVTPPTHSLPIPATPTLPTEKEGGFAYLKLINETRDLLHIELDGPSYQTYELTGNGSLFRVVPWGTYSYVVMRDQQILYRGQITLHNSDKHEFKFYEDKANFLIP